jgi:tetratricopeptide (TPR) repeat protein
MTSESADAVRPTPTGRRRTVLAVAVLSGLLVAGGLGWRAWQRSAALSPPEIALTDDDPLVARAVEEARERIRRSPTDAAAWGALGKILRAIEYLSEAAVCFGQAARLAPTEPRWPYLQGEALLLHGAPEAALPPLRRAAELSAKDSDNALAPRLRLAEALLVAGRYDEAQAALNEASHLEPDHPSIHLALALLASARDDMKGSREHLRRCLHSPFTQKKAHLQLAAVEQRLHHDKAAEQLEKQAAALPRDLHWSDPWVMDCLQKAPGTTGRLHYIEQLEAQDRLRDAVTELRDLLRMGPQVKTLVALSMDLLKLGDLAGAEKALRGALEQAPDNVQAHYLLAKLLHHRAEELWQQGHRAEARKLFRAAAESAQRALARKPDHGLAHMIVGLCLQRLGQPRDALDELTQAVACAPEVSEPSLHLGEALAAVGRTEEARTHLENALRLARPDDPRPRAALERLAATTRKPG